jgi:hypothetical protein
LAKLNQLRHSVSCAHGEDKIIFAICISCSGFYPEYCLEPQGSYLQLIHELLPKRRSLINFAVWTSQYMADGEDKVIFAISLILDRMVFISSYRASHAFT